MSNKGFTSSFGGLVVAIGCAVGLGNIWKFPYEMGQSGGALFLIGYIIVTLVICIPLMIAEFTIGRAGKAGSIIGLKNLSPNTSWWLFGILAVITNLCISFFYVVVGGWIMYYLYATIFMQITPLTDTTAYFNIFIHNKFGASMGALSFLLICFFISVRGVQKGIEKFSMWMIPALGIFLVALTVYSFTLPNVGEAMKYVFKPNFSTFTPSTIIAIVGQSFFSLSLGVGAMILFGSYMLKTDNLVKMAINTSLISAVVVAVLASMLVFNVSFAYHIPPVAGPGLIFMAFPKVFASMHGGYIIAIAFYLLVLLAAITSMIGMTEVPIAFLENQYKLSRKKSTSVVAFTILVVGLLVILSMADVIPVYALTFFATIIAIIIASFIALLIYPNLAKHIKNTYNKNNRTANLYAIILSALVFLIIMLLFSYNKNKGLFDILDTMTSNFLIPIGGVLTAFFMGWVVNKQIIKAELNVKDDNNIWFKSLLFINKYLIPLVIIMVIIYPFI